MTEKSSAASLRESLQRRAYPKLDRRKRRAVRRIFLFGLLHPGAMHHAIWGVNDTLEGLPKDLARVLRDPTITIPRDHEIKLADGRSLFDHLQEWRNAPSNTASGGTDVRS